MLATLHIDWWMVLVAFLLVAPLLHAQRNLTVSVTSPLATLTAAGNSSDLQSMTVTSTWGGSGGFFNFGNVATCVSISSPLTGTNGNPDTIPQANIMVTATTIGTASIAGPGGCGSPIGLQVDTTGEWFLFAGSRTVTMQFQAINTGNLAADTYTGTINILVATD